MKKFRGWILNFGIFLAILNFAKSSPRASPAQSVIRPLRDPKSPMSMSIGVESETGREIQTFSHKLSKTLIYNTAYSQLSNILKISLMIFPFRLFAFMYLWNRYLFHPPRRGFLFGFRQLLKTKHGETLPDATRRGANGLLLNPGGAVRPSPTPPSAESPFPQSKLRNSSLVCL